ncbi:hypothetical protein ABZ319_14215 [Nocardia sp. NPDC005978]|uniref:hypothetical protein n=1 Tax=Nocardia sp. NPDC005978 TaxID=3156725 RepID=UPI0033BC74B2
MSSAARQHDSSTGYAGPRIHCTRWRDDHDLTGLHVAVIGSGAAIARVLPAVAVRARRVTVFQRDPVWVLPAPPLPGARLLRLLPADLLGPLPAHTSAPLAGETVTSTPNSLLRRVTGEALRLAALANLRVQVRDSWQRRQLTPDTTAGVRLHNHYYPALRRAGCSLVTWPIARLAPLGIRTVDGVEHRVDCIIFAEDTL